MSTVEVDEFLEHYGVMGMHWGIRNKNPKLVTHPRGHVVINHPSRKDRKWQKNVYSLKGFMDVHNHVADQMNNGILDKLNNKPEFKNKIFLDDYGKAKNKISEKYLGEYSRLDIEATKRAHTAVHGISPSGNYKSTLSKNSRGQLITTITKTNIHHADIPWEDLVIETELDSFGHIVQLANVKTSAEHSNITNEFLEHFGVMGMHWGITNKAKKKTSSDHKQSSEIRKKSTSQLTNNQLKKANERGNLEQNFHRLNPSKVDRGRHKVKSIFATLGAVGLPASVGALLKTDKGQKIVNKGLKYIQRNPKVLKTPFEQLKLF